MAGVLEFELGWREVELGIEESPWKVWEARGDDLV